MGAVSGVLAAGAPEGVPLSQYAAVVAALEEGFALDDVLAIEGLDAPAWERATVVYRRELAMEPPALERYAKHLAESQERLGRSVEPLDSSLAAWMGFLEQFGSARDPGALMATLGLRSSDLARLQRRWKARFEDEAVQKEAARLQRERSLPPISELELGRSELSASPDARPRFGPPPPSAEEQPASSEGLAPESLAAPSLGLLEFATLSAELEASPEERDRIFARFGLTTPRARQAVVDLWRSRIAADAALKKDFEILLSHASRRVGRSKATARAADAPSAAESSARPAPPVAAPRPPEAPSPLPAPTRGDPPPPPLATPATPPNPLAVTAAAVARQKPKTMPFSQPPGPGSTVGALGSQQRPGPPKAPGVGTGTAPAFKAPIGDAIPFARSRSAPPREASSLPLAGPTAVAPKVGVPPPSLTTTAPQARRPTGPTIPFKPGEGRPPPATPGPERSPADRAEAKAGFERQGGTAPLSPSPPSALSSTAPIPKGPKPPTTPFAAPPVAAPSKLAQSSLSLDIPRHLFAKQAAGGTGVGTAPPRDAVAPAAANPSSAPRPPEAAAPAHPPFVALTLQQYASLQVELSVVPQRAGETLARYGLTPAAKQHVDAEWHRAMTHNPALRAAWQRAYETYYAWFVRERR